MTGAGQIENAVEVASRLVRNGPPPLGVWAILGNHDYGEGWHVESIARTLAEQLGRLSIRVLRNELAWIGDYGLQLIGLDDLWAYRPTGSGSRSDPRVVIGLSDVPPYEKLDHFFDRRRCCRRLTRAAQRWCWSTIPTRWTRPAGPAIADGSCPATRTAGR